MAEIAGAVAEDVAAPATEAVVSDSDLTENQIIEKYSKKIEAPAEAKADETEVEAKSDEAVAEATTEPKPEDEEVPSAEDLEQPLPAEWKTAIKGLKETAPAVAKQIRDEHYALAAYKSAFPQISDAREIRQLFGSVQEAKDTVRAAEELINVQLSYRQDPEGFTQGLFKTDPGAFYGLAGRFNTTLYKIDPDAYRQIVERPIIQGFHDVFARWAASNNDDELVTAIEIIKERLGAKPAQRLDPQNPRDRRLQELEAREAQRREAEAEQNQGATRLLMESAGNSVHDYIFGEVGTMIETSGSTGLSPAAREEVANRTLDEVGKILESDSYLQRRIQFVVRSGGMDHDAKREAISNLLYSKAKTILATKLSEGLRWMTKDILNVQKAEPEIPKVDVGAGGQGGRGAKKKYTQAEFDAMTEDQVIKAALGT